MEAGVEEFNWLKSHPVRVRGLKLSFDDVAIISGCVAPRAGAWIETQMLV